MNMLNHTPLKAALAACLVPQIAAAQQPAQPQRPNVLLIYADDLGFGDLGCYGAKGVSTPNIDRLASQGTRFTNAHAIAATSTPSRYSLLTGEYAWRRPGTDVAAGNAGMIINPTTCTVADIFKGAGYATGAFGKWHLGLGATTGQQDWNAPLASHPGDLGFDHSYIMAATSDRVPCVFIRDGFIANYDPSAPIEVSYAHPFEGEPTGKDNPELLTLHPSHGHDMAIVNGISRIGWMKGGGKALWRDQDIADSIADNAIRFISDETKLGKPFFVYLATNDVHVPRMPHERFRGTTELGLRGEAIAPFDWTVGRVLDALDSLGIADNTLVVLTSDNGPVLDDGYQDQAIELAAQAGHSPTGPLRGGKYSAFEGGTRVPWIVRWPAGGVTAGKESSTLISQIDWTASMAELTGVPVPRGAAPDSRPMAESLLGNGPDRPYVVEEAHNHTLSIRTPQWKYIEPSDGKPRIAWGPDIETGFTRDEQLYDVTTTDYETRNQATAHPEILEQMKVLLDEVRAMPDGDRR